MKRTLVRGAAALVGVMMVALMASAVKWPMVTEVDTAKGGAYPELVGRYYEVESAAVIEAVENFAGEREAWRVARLRPREGEVVLKRRSGWAYWDARVELRVDGVVAGVSEVQARSTIEGGWSDFGHNGRVIRELWRGLDELLEGSRLERGIPGEDEEGDEGGRDVRADA